MGKVLLLAALLPLSAHAGTWFFQIDGLVPEATGYPNPPTFVDGSFTGSDLDADGVLELAEITAFDFAGSQVIPVVTVFDPLGPSQSWLHSFSYANGALSFDAFDGDVMWLKTGDAWILSGPSGGFRSAWGPNTTVLVTEQVPSVPEPSSIALLLAGLTLSAAARRHRSRA